MNKLHTIVLKLTRIMIHCRNTNTIIIQGNTPLNNPYLQCAFMLAHTEPKRTSYTFYLESGINTDLYHSFLSEFT